MIIVSLIGLKKCGKTTAAEALIREFKRRGYRVGGVKFMPHSSITIDVPGKDTWRQREAGADFVISLSQEEIALMEPIREKGGSRPGLDDVLRRVPDDTDILICEGLTDDDPRILRVVLAKDRKLLKETFEVRGVTDAEYEGGSSDHPMEIGRTGWSIEDGTRPVGDNARLIAFSGIMTNEMAEGDRVDGFPDIPAFNCSVGDGITGLADLILKS